jgi:hypothetical protein
MLKTGETPASPLDWMDADWLGAETPGILG